MIETGASAPAAGSHAGIEVRLQLLGGFRVWIDEQPVADQAWRLQKARSLVKLLALSAGHRLARDRVVDLLWPDLDQDAANNNLYQTLHNVRRALGLPHGSRAVHLQHGVVTLLPGVTVRVDVEAFERAAAAARGSDDIARYRDALALYTGELLPEDLYEDWAAWRREGLRATYLDLLLDLARRHEARGELSAALETLSRAIEVDPIREEAYAELIRLYAATGQPVRAARQYRVLQDVLARELDVEPGEETEEVHRALINARPGSSNRSVPSIQHNLPFAMTSFIGRRREVAEITRLLADTRLLTLTGVGGAGKTRLAIRAGWDLLDTYHDGVWFVPLAQLADPELLPRHLADTLHVETREDESPIDRIVEHLTGRKTLIVLDNCEHLVDACRALCRHLLFACPQLHIAATSRARLDIPGELTFAVAPLSLPSHDDVHPETLASSEAVQLFIERARFRRPGFQVTAANAPSLRAICLSVEGIPLALELAAARVGTLSTDQIAARLAESGRLLSTRGASEARHRSLAAALDWSYDLLTGDERTIFRKLAVFSGWTIEAAEDFFDGDIDQADLLELISRLVDASLVVAEGAGEGEVRYRLLEPVRVYALERLRDANEEEDTRRRHALVYADLAERAEPELRSYRADQWIRRLEIEHGNLRTGLQWSIDAGEPEIGLRMVVGLWRFWYSRGYLAEGRDTARRLLAIGDGARDIDQSILADAHNGAGAMAFYQTDATEALAEYQRALALREASDDFRGQAATLSNIALVLKDQGQFDQAAGCLERAIALARTVDDHRSLASSLGNLGILYQDRGEFDRAGQLHEESLALTRALGDMPVTALNNLGALAIEQEDYARALPLVEEAFELSVKAGVKRSQAVALINLGHIERARGQYDGALARYRAGLEIAHDTGETVLLAVALEGVAGALVDTGDAERAARLLTVAGRLRGDRGTPPPDNERRRIVAIRESIRVCLGDRFEAIWNDARSHTVEDTVKLALKAST